MRLTDEEENRMLDLEEKKNLTKVEGLELQRLLAILYDTGDWEEEIK